MKDPEIDFVKNITEVLVQLTKLTVDTHRMLKELHDSWESWQYDNDEPAEEKLRKGE